MDLEQKNRTPVPARASKRQGRFDARHALPLTQADPTSEFIEAVYTLASIAIALPAYLLMSLLLALAFYVRCATVLLTID